MHRALQKVLLPLGLFVCAAPLWAAQTADEGLTKSVPCAACHQDLTKNYFMSRHGVTADSRTPGKNCSTCHGETLRHMSNPMKEKPQFTFKKDVNGFMSEENLKASNAVCTSCHKGGEQKHWAHSAHENAQVGCVSCHSNHKADVALNDRTSTALCISCHAEQKADLFKTTAHPLLSGQMNCVSCHNPHGSQPGDEAMTTKGNTNDTCYSCHPGKRGPFLHGHQPVTEDCGNCHNPHGTNKGAMLKMSDPMLCKSCHAASHHSPTDTVNAARGCLNCHPQVHGSNHIDGRKFEN